MNRLDPDDASSPTADRHLKRAVRDASIESDGAAVEALAARVLADWQAQHVVVVQRSGAAASAASPRRSRRVWAGAVGVAAVVAVATAIVAGRPDPALEELMQPDVLSQLAIGEM